MKSFLCISSATFLIDSTGAKLIPLFQVLVVESCSHTTLQLGSVRVDTDFVWQGVTSFSIRSSLLGMTVCSFITLSLCDPRVLVLLTPFLYVWKQSSKLNIVVLRAAAPVKFIITSRTLKLLLYLDTSSYLY